MMLKWIKGLFAKKRRITKSDILTDRAIKNINHLSKAIQKYNYTVEKAAQETNKLRRVLYKMKSGRNKYSISTPKTYAY